MGDQCKKYRLDLIFKIIYVIGVQKRMFYDCNLANSLTGFMFGFD